MGKAWFARAMRTIADKVTDTLSPHVSPEMLQRLQRSQTRVDAQQEAQAKRRRQQVAEARERSPAAEEEAEPPSAAATATAAAAPDAPPGTAPTPPPAAATPAAPPPAPTPAAAPPPPATAASTPAPPSPAAPPAPAAPLPSFGAHWGLPGTSAPTASPAQQTSAESAPPPPPVDLNKPINFLVKTIGKRLIPVEGLLPTHTVRRLKFKFEELENVAPRKQDLYHKNVLMREDRMLKDYGVTEGSIISMIYVGDD